MHTHTKQQSNKGGWGNLSNTLPQLLPGPPQESRQPTKSQTELAPEQTQCLQTHF